jgi:uncharacterized membrane protein YjgN (DUF898 family)
MPDHADSHLPDDRAHALRQMAASASRPGGDSGTDAPAAIGPLSRAAEAERIPISFNGRGGEYFRIWIVNLLLMVVTFGLYYPWAKVRKLRYFYTHTQVGGHALDFHGDPRKMLRGTLLMALLFGLYSLAGEVSEVAGVVALAIIAAIWPALFRASSQFRLAHTSWRGLRFAFTGSTKAAYLAFGVPLLALAGIGAAVGFWIAGLVPGPGQAGTGNGPLIFGAFAVGVLALYAMVPVLWFRIKRYLHGHLAFGRLGSEFRASQAAFFGVFVRTGLVTLLALGLAGGALALAAYAMWPTGLPPRRAFAALFGLLPVAFLVLFIAQFAPRAYFSSRMQNLLWSRTGNRYLRFKSELGFRSLWWLMLKNTLLVMLTLGLYWPWAAVALARLRLHAMVLVTRVDLDRIAAAAARTQAGDAAGDAAADLFGVDFGI